VVYKLSDFISCIGGLLKGLMTLLAVVLSGYLKYNSKIDTMLHLYDHETFKNNTSSLQSFITKKDNDQNDNNDQQNEGGSDVNVIPQTSRKLLTDREDRDPDCLPNVAV